MKLWSTYSLQMIYNYAPTPQPSTQGIVPQLNVSGDTLSTVCEGANSRPIWLNSMQNVNKLSDHIVDWYYPTLL